MQVLMGELWTGRIYDYKKIRHLFSEAHLICVMRWPPKFIDMKTNGIVHMPAMSPSEKLLGWYKKEIKVTKLSPIVFWHEFVKKFYGEIKKRNKFKKNVLEIRQMLLGGDTVVLLCHERPDEDCHRKLLPHIILDDEEKACYCGEVSLEPLKQSQLDWW